MSSGGVGGSFRCLRHSHTARTEILNQAAAAMKRVMPGPPFGWVSLRDGERTPDTQGVWDFVR